MAEEDRGIARSFAARIQAGMAEFCRGGTTKVLLGFSFYWAWIFATIISHQNGLWNEGLLGVVPGSSIEFLARAVALCVLMCLFGHKPVKRFVGKHVLPLGVIGAASMAFLGLSGIMPSSLGFPLEMLAWVMMGISDAFMLLGWLGLYRYTNTHDVVIAVCLSNVLAAGLFMVACSIVGPFSVVFIACLPLASACFLFSAQRDAPDAMKDELEQCPKDPSGSVPGYRRAVVAIAVYGLVLGVFQSLSQYDSASAISFYARAAGVGLAALLALGLSFWPSLSKESVVYRVALPVTACGLLLMQLVGSSVALASFFILVGFSLFDVMSVIIILRIIALRDFPTIRYIGISRVANTLGILVGQIVGGFFAKIISVSADAISISSSALLLLIILGSGLLLDSGVPNEDVADPPHEDGCAQTAGKDCGRPNSWQRQCDLVSSQYGLSPREGEVLSLLAKGRDAEYISNLFVISPHTAKTHIHNVYKKLGIHSQQALIDMVEDAAEQLKN